MVYILDACALIALLQREPGGELVDALLAGKNNICMAHAINLCEVYYDLMRRTGESIARNAISGLLKAGIRIREDMDIEFWQKAGQLKSIYRRISLADCICATLANRTGGSVVTADNEYLPLKDADICNVTYIR